MSGVLGRSSHFSLCPLCSWIRMWPQYICNKNYTIFDSFYWGYSFRPVGNGVVSTFHQIHCAAIIAGLHTSPPSQPGGRRSHQLNVWGASAFLACCSGSAPHSCCQRTKAPSSFSPFATPTCILNLFFLYFIAYATIVVPLFPLFPHPPSPLLP